RSTIRRIEAISTTERRASAGFRRGGANAREASAATGMAKVKARRRRRPKTPPRRSALGGLGAMGPREVQAGQPAVGLPPLRGQAVLLLELRPGLSSLVPLLLALVDPRLAVERPALQPGLRHLLEGDQGANEVALSLQRQGLALQREGAEGVVGGRLFEEGLVKRERGVVVALGVANVGQRQGGGQTGGRPAVIRSDRLEGLGQRLAALGLAGEGFLPLAGLLPHRAVDEGQGLR